MQQDLFENLKKYAKKNRRRRIWQRIVSGLGCIVVFCTTYALILPAITQENDTFCGVEAHEHEESCYSESTSHLTCSAVHVHTADCTDAQGNNLCGKADYAVHTHDAACLDESGNLVCVLPEIKVHEHMDDCYEIVAAETHVHETDCYAVEKGDLICETEESEGHSHGDACYTLGTNYVCQKEETEGHAHGEGCHETVKNMICQSSEEDHVHEAGCYETVENLICELPEVEAHVHGDACFEKVLSCELEESLGHQHGDDCYAWTDVLTCEQTVSTEETAAPEKTLICTRREVKLHTHTDACYADSKLVCGQLEVLEHVHGESCFTTSAEEGTLICQVAEHTHELMCYSNPDADLETPADWEQTFAHVELTGVWEDDVLSIAKTQLGYHESTKNYMVWEDDSTHGYTRYGEWFGIPYGDWCAMFASFCLNYAGVEGMPLNNSCDPWIAALSAEEYDLYRPAAEHTPQPGELIFFDWNVNGNSEHVGIVAEIVPATEEETAKIRTIEGNSANCVQYVTYEADAAVILGYAVLPYQPTEEERAQIDEVIAMIDAMPSADEIDAKMLEYEEAGDYDGLESWYTETAQQVARAYKYYSELTEEQQKLVTNRDKLLELEYIWSVTVLIDDITSDKPTTVISASTSDFIDMNLYDYGSNINDKYKNTQTISYLGKTNGEWVTKYTSMYPGFQWNGGAYAKSDYKESLYVDGEYRYSADRNKIDSIDFGNSLITDGVYSGSNNAKSTTATDITINTAYYYNINSMDVSSTYGVTNRPIGLGLASSSTDTSKDVLKRTLGADGYPALKDGTSLSYLFSNNAYATKKNSVSIDGLFQQNATSGEYYYNSRWNHAQYSSNKFTLYNQIITPNFITYPFGNFLPLNDITNGSNATQVGKITSMSTYVQQTINDLIGASDYNSNASKQQLVDMLAMYRTNVKYYGINGKTWSTFGAKDAIIDYFCGDQNGDNPSDDTSLITTSLLNKMYNIDWDVKTNFFFGMDMTMNFMQPKDGMTGNDNGDNDNAIDPTTNMCPGDPDGLSDYPMEFYFTGDDDVWVYIDGVLFLDLSGIHRHVGGEIDFVNGKVHYYYLDTENGGDVHEGSLYKTYTFAEILSAAGKSTDGLNSNGTFKDYTNHQFKFYYMERGSGSSVCRLNFNFPLLRQNSISVSKAVSADTKILGNPDYKFQVLKANSDGTKTNNLFIAEGTTYTIYDANDNVVGTGTTDANGVFTLKAGQRAEFTGIKENAGKYYVRELLEGTVLDQYGNVTVSGESTTTSNNVTVGSDTFTGMDSPVKDMSDGATAFRFTNDVDEDKLGNLSISKKLTEYPQAKAIKYYDIEVTLDGVKLPVGTEYTVGGETRTVTTAGIITIAADETATISNILAGTAFTVQETSGSAEGYTVTYTDSGGYSITVNDGVVNGVIKTSANVQLVVTNSEKGAAVTIPGTKSLVKYDGNEHTYTFRLTEVTDSTGNTVKEGGITDYTDTAAVTNAPTDFSFTINYAQVDMVSLPQTFYYKITEDAADDSLANSTVYVAEVTVSKNAATEELEAAVTGMWKDGAEITDRTAAFTNTLVGDLSMSKTVNGSSTDQSFGFNITLASGDSGVDLTGMKFQVSGENADETPYVNEVGSSFNFTIQHGETLTIHGIPIGVKWTITETDAVGFVPSYEVTSGTVAEPVDGHTASGTIVLGNTNLAFTNTQLYELPETGGAGVTTYTMAGLMLMLCSAAFLLYRFRKRRREGY